LKERKKRKKKKKKIETRRIKKSGNPEVIQKKSERKAREIGKSRLEKTDRLRGLRQDGGSACPILL